MQKRVELIQHEAGDDPRLGLAASSSDRKIGLASSRYQSHTMFQAKR